MFRAVLLLGNCKVVPVPIPPGPGRDWDQNFDFFRDQDGTGTEILILPGPGPGLKFLIGPGLFLFRTRLCIFMFIFFLWFRKFRNRPFLFTISIIFSRILILISRTETIVKPCSGVWIDKLAWDIHEFGSIEFNRSFDCSIFVVVRLYLAWIE